jgi:uncharacterized protein (DUF3084 family)
MKKRGFDDVESEIRKEKAEVLGRVGERLEQALQELEAFRQQLLGLVLATRQTVRDREERFPVEIDKKLAEYARLREQAKALRHSLIIQREAVGLSRHEDVDRQYPLPGPLSPPSATHHAGER